MITLLFSFFTLKVLKLLETTIKFYLVLTLWRSRHLLSQQLVVLQQSLQCFRSNHLLHHLHLDLIHIPRNQFYHHQNHHQLLIKMKKKI